MTRMTLSSPVFRHLEPIPRKYTGDGEDRSPPLNWSAVPAGTQQLALIVNDPDAPTPQPWIHWLLYRIPSALNALPEAIVPALHVAEPPGLVQGRNSWNRIGYGGPAPPRGHGLHHYHFKLYALDQLLNLEPGVTGEILLQAVAGHVLAEAELIGTYQR